MAADNFLWFPAPATGGLLIGKATQPEGETSDNWFSKKQALEIKSVTFGVSQAETSGSGTTGAAAGKAKFEEFTVEKFVDLASVPLYNACTAGAHFPSVMLAVRKAGGSPLLYAQYMFRMVFVTAINWTGGGGEEAPAETIKFKFGAMGIQYIQQLATGGEGKKMIGLWSTVTNTPTMDMPAGYSGPAPKFEAGTQG
jgi:type VI secretion system secreted protein Hcp